MRSTNSGTDSAGGEIPHRKQVNIELWLAYREGRSAIVITPGSSVENSDNCCINRSIYCITFLVQDITSYDFIRGDEDKRLSSECPKHQSSNARLAKSRDYWESECN